MTTSRNSSALLIHLVFQIGHFGAPCLHSPLFFCATKGNPTAHHVALLFPGHVYHTALHVSICIRIPRSGIKLCVSGRHQTISPLHMAPFCATTRSAQLCASAIECPFKRPRPSANSLNRHIPHTFRALLSTTCTYIQSSYTQFSRRFQKSVYILYQTKMLKYTCSHARNKSHLIRGLISLAFAAILLSYMLTFVVLPSRQFVSFPFFFFILTDNTNTNLLSSVFS